jgi:hypothetical protein
LPSDLERWPATKIEQGYLAVDEDGPEVARARPNRRRGRDHLVRTLKGANSRVGARLGEG